jgi:hypothetical protein
MQLAEGTGAATRPVDGRSVFVDRSA